VKRLNSRPVNVDPDPHGTPSHTGRAQTLLLGRDDPAPFVLLQEQGAAPLLVVCDHASRAFPASLQRLGLDELASWQHIAWDIGAGELARGISHALDAPAVLAGYSRLVVDCNRSPDDVEAFRPESDGWVIPGNRQLDVEARRLRLATFFDAYHECIAAMLSGFRTRRIVPLIVSVHSFAARLEGNDRPWHVGVLWDTDELNARRMMQALAAESGLEVGDNQPYSGKHPANYTIERHATAAGLPHVCLEVRQDLLQSPAGIERWVRLLAREIGALIARPESLRLLHSRAPAWPHLNRR
jgi:predicted N-formylglutamate amidohydrolase